MEKKLTQSDLRVAIIILVGLMVMIVCMTLKHYIIGISIMALFLKIGINNIKDEVKE